jgi:NAD(P)H-hydrate epimerase
MEIFKPEEIKKLYRPDKNSSKEDNGQITVIGGSSLFHGAPILVIKTTSRIVDMVFFSSPEKTLGEIASKIKSSVSSFIWVPWKEIKEYIQKSDAVLIGPGFMRYRSEKQKKECEIKGICTKEAEKTRKTTLSLIKKFPDKKWVIDAGSLQTIKASELPKNSIITPNKKEFNLVFGDEVKITEKTKEDQIEKILLSLSKKYQIFIVFKGPVTFVSSSQRVVAVKGGNAGLTKGGTGDILAGLCAAFYAKNDAFLSACAASYLVKKAADILFEKVGFTYNADDLADEIPKTLKELIWEAPKWQI